MPAILQVYTIGVSETSAEDIYNLHEDSDVIEGAAEPSSLDTCESKVSRRVSSYAEISAVEEFESSFYQVQGHAVILSTEEYYDPDTVIGVAEISSIWGDTYIKGVTNGKSVVSSPGLDISIDLATQSNGVSKVSARVSYQWADESTVEAYSQIIDYLYDKEIAAFVDYSEIGGGIVPTDFSGYFEVGEFTLSSSILSYSSLPGTIGATGPVSSVENMYLRMNTPDSSTVSGEAIIRGFIDEYGDVTGVAELLSDVPDALGQITSSGHDEGGPPGQWPVSIAAVGVAEIYATSSVVRLSGETDGSSLVTEGLYQLIINAAEYSTDPDVAFRYTISAIEEYTYVPALTGYASGESMLPGPTGASGPVLTVAPILLYYKPAALVGSSEGSSVVEGTITVPKSFYDDTVLTAPKPGRYDVGEYA